jgi:hypothetical protein
MLVHPLDRIPVQLKLADDRRREIKPGGTQLGQRYRLLAGTPQQLKR